jgi:hypothetical protein
MAGVVADMAPGGLASRCLHEAPSMTGLLLIEDMGGGPMP